MTCINGQQGRLWVSCSPFALPSYQQYSHLLFSPPRHSVVRACARVCPSFAALALFIYYSLCAS